MARVNEEAVKKMVDLSVQTIGNLLRPLSSLEKLETIQRIQQKLSKEEGYLQEIFDKENAT